MSSLRTKIGCALAAVAGVAATLAPSPALAADSGYQGAAASWRFGVGTGSAGGYLSCPTGTKAVSSGAASSATLGYLQSGLTTFDGNGGYHTALGYQSMPFQAYAQCVPAARLSGSTRTTRTVRDHTGEFRAHVKRVDCPSGTVPYGGGAFTSYQGNVEAGLATFGSVPSGLGWSYGGAGTVSGELVVSSHCLPRAKLGRVVTESATVAGPTTDERAIVSAAARCPSGFFAFAGGASFHQPGSLTPAWRGYLTTSTMSADDRGWSAVGWTFAPDTRMTVTVRCTDRLG
ncbi:MAG TPA: hypothetical protein VER39_08975 [Nocardioidaceae bacterium]|nr:hypothetical protein [Nocardioidaceae bacterium]